MKATLRALLTLAGMALLVVAFNFGEPLFWSFLQKRDLDRKVAELEKRGESFDVAKLAPGKVPVEGNGGEALMKACQAIEETVKPDKGNQVVAGLLARGRGRAEVMSKRPAALREKQQGDLSWEDVERRLVPLRPHFAELRRVVTEYPVLSIDLEYGDGMDMGMRHLPSLLDTSRYLTVNAIFQIRQGDLEGAVNDIETLLKMTQLPLGQPIVISQMVGLMMIEHAQAATWELMQTEEVTDGQLKRLQTVWEALRPVAGFAMCLRFERASMRPYFSDPEKLAEASDLIKKSSENGESSTWKSNFRIKLNLTRWRWQYRYGDELKYVENVQSYLDLLPDDPEADLPWPRIYETWGQINVSPPEERLSQFFSYMMNRQVEHPYRRFGTVDALQRLTVAALAIRRYQLAHAGAVPPSLAALVPEYLTAVPSDPLDGTTLKYRVEDGDFVLYSAGLNCKDDGGSTANPERKRWFLHAEDIVWPKPEEEAKP